MKREIIVFLLLVFALNIVSANVTCDQISEISVNVGEVPSPLTINCINDNNSTVTINSFNGYFSFSTNYVSMNSTPITLNFNQFDEPGVFSDIIYFSDGTSPLQVTINVEDVSTGCRLIELPHTTNYRIKQGETGASSQIRLKVSNECNEPMSLTVTEQTQMSKPMYLQGSSGDVSPGDYFSFTIGLDAEGVSTGTYQNSYIVSGSIGDEIYKKVINLGTIVTIGTSPIGENTFSDLPSCIIESDLQINETYSVKCTIMNPNIDIEIPYNPLFKGIGVIESEGLVEYKFIPMDVGITNFVVLFKYKGLNIGEPFKKEVRVMRGVVPIQGTELNVLFYQNGEKKNIETLLDGTITILVKDSNTDSIVPSFEVYLNGEKKNNTFSLNQGKDYELIISSEGYVSKTINLTINQEPLEVSISPSKTFYFVGEEINLTSNKNGTSFTVDGIIAGSPYKLKKSGNVTVKGFLDGYIPYEENILVKDKVYIVYSSCNLELEKWKKGKEIVCKLNKNSSWEIHLNNTIISKGDGNLIQFKVEDYGTIEVFSDGINVFSKTIEKKGFFSFIDEYKWYLFIILLLGIGFFYVSKNKDVSEDKSFVFTPRG